MGTELGEPEKNKGVLVRPGVHGAAGKGCGKGTEKGIWREAIGGGGGWTEVPPSRQSAPCACSPQILRGRGFSHTSVPGRMSSHTGQSCRLQGCPGPSKVTPCSPGQVPGTGSARLGSALGTVILTWTACWPQAEWPCFLLSRWCLVCNPESSTRSYSSYSRPRRDQQQPLLFLEASHPRPDQRSPTEALGRWKA